MLEPSEKTNFAEMLAGSALPPAEVMQRILERESGSTGPYVVVCELRDEALTPTEELAKGLLPAKQDLYLSRNPAKLKGWFRVLSSGIPQNAWRKCHSKNYWGWYASDTRGQK